MYFNMITNIIGYLFGGIISSTVGLPYIGNYLLPHIWVSGNVALQNDGMRKD